MYQEVEVQSLLKFLAKENLRIFSWILIFLKEDAAFVSEAIYRPSRDASAQAKKKSDDAMGGLTGGMQMPGLF
jgi:hypothetical protein